MISRSVLAGFLLVAGALSASLLFSPPPPSPATVPPAHSTTHPVEPAPSNPPSPPSEIPSEPADPTPAPTTGTLIVDVLTDSGIGAAAELSLHERIPECYGGGPVEDQLRSAIADEAGRAVITEVPVELILWLDVSHPGSVTKGVEVEPLEPGEVRHLPPVSLDPAGHISGVVIDEAGRGIEDARIGFGRLANLISVWESSFDRESSITTDSRGRFEIVDLEPGEKTLLVWAPGFLINQSARFSIEPNETTFVEVQLQLGDSVEGQVVYEDGQPVEGAKVTVGNPDRSHQVTVKAVTDRAGRYRLHGVAPGRLEMEVTHGSLQWDRSFDRVEELPEEVVLSRGGHLRVFLFDEAGRPLSGGSVYARKKDSSGYQSESSDERGIVDFYHLRAGVNVVTSSNYDYDDRKEEVTIRPGETASLRWTLTRISEDPKIVELQLRTVDRSGAPIVGVDVTLAARYDGGRRLDYYEGTTDEDGWVSLEYPADPSPQIWMSKAGWAFEDREFEIPNEGEATLIHELVPEARIDLLVFEGGEPVADVKVELNERSIEPEEGKFSAGQLPAGEVEVIAFLPSGALMSHHVELEEGESRLEEIHFPEPSEVLVQVLVHGRAMDEGELYVSRVEDESSEHHDFYLETSDLEDGEVLMSIHFPGEYRFIYEHTELDISIEENRRIQGPTRVVLQAEGSRLSGQVLTPDGSPLARHHIRFGTSWNNERSRFLDEEGRFVVETFEPGTFAYSVENIPTGLVPYGTFTVAEDVRSKTIVLEPGRWIMVRRTDDMGSDYRGNSWKVYKKLGPRWTTLSASSGDSDWLMVPYGEHTLHVGCRHLKRSAKFQVKDDQDEYEVELMPNEKKE